MTALQWIQAISPFAIAVAGFVYSYFLAKRQASADAITSEHLRRVDAITDTVAEFVSVISQFAKRDRPPGLGRRAYRSAPSRYDQDSWEGDLVLISQVYCRTQILLDADNHPSHERLLSLMSDALIDLRHSEDKPSTPLREHVELITNAARDVVAYEQRQAQNTM
jgi:hypothetical protein